MSDRPEFTVEYLEPQEIDAEPLPDEFSSSRLRRSLLILGAIVLLVIAAIVLVPGLASLRDRFSGAQPEWLALAALLQLGSCAFYVLVFRGVFRRRMSWRTRIRVVSRYTPSMRRLEPSIIRSEGVVSRMPL